MKPKNPVVRKVKTRGNETVTLSRYSNVICVIGKDRVINTLNFDTVSGAKEFMNNPTGL